MGLFKKMIKNTESQDNVVFIRSYKSLARFKGTRKLHVTVYGDKENANRNALQLLGDKDTFGSAGCEITLTGFTFDNSSGIKVAVDGRHVGIVFDGYNEKYYADVFHGEIDGVFVKVDRDAIYGEPDRAAVALFVALRG
jgi:hypothetical protein